MISTFLLLPQVLKRKPVLILVGILTFFVWSGFVGIKAYNMGYDAKEAEYAAEAIKRIREEAEAARLIAIERQKERQKINRTERKIKDEAKKYDDGPASDRLRSISDSLRKRWRQDHK